ncbi:MAG: sugar transferase [Ignavibacteria bacterium]|nr:sugar transferase [Ignavibacteria bacterium]
MNDFIQRTERVSTATVNDGSTVSDYLKNRNNEILLFNLDNLIVEYISQFTTIDENSVVLKSNESKQIDSLPTQQTAIINIHKINDLKHINKYFALVNGKLSDYGFFICCVETIEERKNRILGKFPKIISYPYYFLDFILKRVFPKFSLTRRMYFYLTNGKNRTLSKTETFGRLLRCGFEIVDYKNINNHLYVACKKIKEISFVQESAYSFLIKLKRYGENGKIINVYKMRTMHPYGEYLQDYVYRQNHLIVKGKFCNDFRVTRWGRFFRKYWLDEMPMIINLLKGDLKLFGVRPLSMQYYDLYGEELKQKRSKCKPGLIPPFYADLPEDFSDIMNSEERYLNAYEKNPVKTDLKYLVKALYNILVKGARSS